VARFAHCRCTTTLPQRCDAEPLEPLMIVLGVDFSEGSAAAATVALRLAEERGERVQMIHVRPSEEHDVPSEPCSRAWLERHDLVSAHVEVRTGVPWVELVRAADQRKASFLVAGTHGLRGAQPLRLGTTAGLVALRSTTPVVLVPPMREAAPAAGRIHEHLVEER
jgi:nucleotide-binding universal stress UspA family protein